MIEDFIIGPRLGDLVEKVVASYKADSRTQHIDQFYLPARAQIIGLVKDLLELLYPGFIGRQHLTAHNVAFHVGDLLPRIGEVAFRQTYECLRYAGESGTNDAERSGRRSGRPLDTRLTSTSDLMGPADQEVARCSQRSTDQGDERTSYDRAREVTLALLEGIPKVRELLSGDVQAAFDGDPAALNLDEVMLAYPGLLAISIHRLAHLLYDMRVPLMPRIMSEWAHTKTGIDIHPGARIGRNFFIDHGTGVVIGETTDIGDNVKIYQGVTLGALSFPKDERGRVIREAKRHPTVCDNVTIYANAIVLGGDTVLGEHSVIGGSVFVTSSVPPH
jgi:serine O-acetyltransferase